MTANRNASGLNSLIDVYLGNLLTNFNFFVLFFSLLIHALKVTLDPTSNNKLIVDRFCVVFCIHTTLYALVLLSVVLFLILRCVAGT